MGVGFAYGLDNCCLLWLFLLLMGFRSFEVYFAVRVCIVVLRSFLWLVCGFAFFGVVALLCFGWVWVWYMLLDCLRLCGLPGCVVVNLVLVVLFSGWLGWWRVLHALFWGGWVDIVLWVGIGLYLCVWWWVGVV